MLLGACACFGTGCYSDAEAEPAVAEATDPPPLRFYMGSEVYYDTAGRAYIYDGGTVSYVPVGALREYSDRFDGRAYGPADFEGRRAHGARGPHGHGHHVHAPGGWHAR